MLASCRHRMAALVTSLDYYKNCNMIEGVSPEQLKAGRLQTSMTQVQAAECLGVSQSYLSQLEKGERAISMKLARSAAAIYGLPATALPIPKLPETAPVTSNMLARQLAGLGYPGFAHLRHAKANPAAVVFEALRQENLEVRLAEALPWVVVTYADMDWSWLIRELKLRDAQNRLGFVVALAEELATTRPRFWSALDQLSSVTTKLERARLAREDTLCRASMLPAEREWLVTTRSALARHWNLLTGLTIDQLSHVL